MSTAAATGGETGVLRLAGAGDLPSIWALTEEAYKPYTQVLDAPPIPVTEDYAPRIARGEVWLLDVSGEMAGSIVLERHADHMMIFSVAMAPRFQGRGLGLKLLRFADEQATQAGYEEIRLYTNARMERNIALYTAFGYRETGRRANPMRKGWILVDMTKRLSRESPGP
jgi:ribosomal protein S18 acetylase RimI-like enzyme